MYHRSMHGAVHVIRGDEPLTESSVDELQEIATSLLDSGQPFSVLDMSEIKLMDSAGLESIIEIRQQFTQRGGSLKLACPVPLCRNIMHVTGVEDEFEIFSRLSEAVGSFLR